MSYTAESLKKMHAKAIADFKSTNKVLQKTRRTQIQKLDAFFHDHHRREFDKITCIECANCCKLLSPAISDSDIRRMAKQLRLKLPDFIDRYLHKENEGSYVFRSIPCPFLMSDNYCAIYNVRPRACREYPHTDRKRMHQIIDITAKNSTICPAVFNMIERMKQNPTNS